MAKQKTVLFLVPYPLHRAPSQRFRVELFLPELQSENIAYTIAPFLDAKTWAVLYGEASWLQKAFGVLRGFLRRLWILFSAVPFASYVFIHREAAPVGPPVFEFLISKVFRKKIIYDFDDAIWIATTAPQNKLATWVKAFWKVKYTCQWAYKVVGGNQYLCAYARQYNNNVVLIPTCVDVVTQHNTLKQQKTSTITIGWTGSHSTLPYLDPLVPVLEKISASYQVSLIIICNKPPAFQLPNVTFVPWREATEIQDLLQINIGIMPLQADPWCEGKCGFKIIQYLALGIPAVASPIGVNKQLIDAGETGYLCKMEDEWYAALATLIENEALRERMGTLGRQKIVAQYSIQANAVLFTGLFA